MPAGRACEFCNRDDAEACDCVERMNCPDAGKFGHHACGRCLHDPAVPRFKCGDCFATVRVAE